MRTAPVTLVATLLLVGPAVLAGAAVAGEEAGGSSGEATPARVETSSKLDAIDGEAWWIPVVGVLTLALFAGAGWVAGRRLVLDRLRERIHRQRLVEFEVVGRRRVQREAIRPAMASGSQVGLKGGA